jgi:Xaa-Pro aminopeptidase
MTDADLAAFRVAQRLAYRCVQEVGDGLSPGDTERDACQRMTEWLRARGVTEWFHRPFAWFGDRTAFAGFRTPRAFFPTRCKLEPGVPFILDVAPVVDGCTADVGYTSWLGECPPVERVLDDLAHHRALIAELVPTRSLGDVYDAVVGLARRQGYEIRHRAYPFGVLGHRVERLAPPTSAFARTLGKTTIGAFGLRSLSALGKLARDGAVPLWNDRFAASRPLPHGMWAVEPHLALRGFGAKFEEILVVDADGARWLDDDLPHVRRWRRQPEVTA